MTNNMETLFINRDSLKKGSNNMPHRDMPRAHPLWVDCDDRASSLTALVIAARGRGARLLGVSTTGTRAAVHQIVEMLYACGRSDVPVVGGRTTPLLQPYPADVAAADGDEASAAGGGAGANAGTGADASSPRHEHAFASEAQPTLADLLPELRDSNASAGGPGGLAGTPAAVAMADAIRGCPAGERVTIVCLGAATNVALMLMLCPEIRERIAKVVGVISAPLLGRLNGRPFKLRGFCPGGRAAPKNSKRIAPAAPRQAPPRR